MPRMKKGLTPDQIAKRRAKRGKGPKHPKPPVITPEPGGGADDTKGPKIGPPQPPLQPPKDPTRDFTGEITNRPPPGGFGSWDEYNQWRQDLRGGRGGQPGGGIFPGPPGGGVIPDGGPGGGFGGPGPRPIGPPDAQGIRPDLIGPPLQIPGGGGIGPPIIGPAPQPAPPPGSPPGGTIMPPPLPPPGNFLGQGPGGLQPPVQNPGALPPQSFPFFPAVAPGINPQQQFIQMLLSRMQGGGGGF